jgi:hypothetical protein
LIKSLSSCIMIWLHQSIDRRQKASDIRSRIEQII